MRGRREEMMRKRSHLVQQLRNRLMRRWVGGGEDNSTLGRGLVKLADNL